MQRNCGNLRSIGPRRLRRLTGEGQCALSTATGRHVFTLPSHSRLATAFTLIELMVVVGIMGLVLMIAIPGIYRTLHPDPLQKAVDDVREACKAARELAVMRTSPTVLAIDLKGKSFSVQGSSAPAPSSEMGSRAFGD